MNRKGFTLVELIAVIALLAIIAIISFVSINSVIDKSKVSDCENLKLSIETATKDYMSDKRYKLNEIDRYKVNDKTYEIDALVLINNNYLSSDVVDKDGNIVLDNPFNDDYIYPKDVSIYIELNGDYTVNEIEINGPEILKTCKSE